MKDFMEQKNEAISFVQTQKYGLRIVVTNSIDRNHEMCCVQTPCVPAIVATVTLGMSYHSLRSMYYTVGPLRWHGNHSIQYLRTFVYMNGAHVRQDRSHIYLGSGMA